MASSPVAQSQWDSPGAVGGRHRIHFTHVQLNHVAPPPARMRRRKRGRKRRRREFRTGATERCQNVPRGRRPTGAGMSLLAATTASAQRPGRRGDCGGGTVRTRRRRAGSPLSQQELPLLATASSHDRRHRARGTETPAAAVGNPRRAANAAKLRLAMTPGLESVAFLQGGRGQDRPRPPEI